MADTGLTLVDMPGYGYAAAAKSKIVSWTRLIHDYLHGRATLARVYVLVDARHGLKPPDDTILDTLGKAAVSHEIVLTNATRSTTRRWPNGSTRSRRPRANGQPTFPDLVATSARSGAGMD